MATAAGDMTRVSFAVMAFNQEALIGQTLKGALDQDYGNLEIVIADDGSSDATYARILETVKAYDGPHEVRVLERGENLGIARNFQRLIAACRSDFIVYSDGDDISEPDRVRKLTERRRVSDARAMLILSSFMPIDAQSNPVKDFDEGAPFEAPTLEDLAAGRIHCLGATMGFTRNVFERFPAMAEDIKHVDRVIPFRVMLLGGVIDHIDEALVRYRISGGVSRGRARSGSDYLRLVEPARQARLLADAKQRLADLAAVDRPSETLRKACLKTIEGHRAFLAFSTASPWRYEAITLARPSAWKTYLKFRFLPLFALYYGVMRPNK